MDSYSIRQAISSDIPALIELDHGYSSDHVWQMSIDQKLNEVGVVFRQVRLPRPMRVTYPRDPKRLADEWTRRAALLVAEREDLVFGYLSIIEGPAQETGWITDIVVGLRHRRQGIASRMLAYARGWCRERGLKRMYMEMQSKNFPALSLARKLGFIFTGYSDSYYSDQDIALFFSLELF